MIGWFVSSERLSLDWKASFRWKRRCRRGRGRSFVLCWCLHTHNVCVHMVYHRNQNRAEPRSAQEESDQRETEKTWQYTWDTGIYLDKASILQLERKEAILFEASTSTLPVTILHKEARKKWQWPPPGLSKMRSLLSKVFTFSAHFLHQTETFSRGIYWYEQAWLLRMKGTFYVFSIGKQTGRSVRPKALFEKRRKPRLSPQLRQLLQSLFF